MIVLFVLLYSLCIELEANNNQNRQFRIRDRKIVDSHNRQIYFHGTNVVVKVPPYIPITDKFDERMSFCDEDIKLLKENGFNSIRLGVMWAGVQPKKDWYNETYLEQMVKIVNKAGQAGIYTLVEYHQDLFSEVFCGDGVPIWLVDEIKRYKTFPFPVKSKKFPRDDSGIAIGCDQIKQWGLIYFANDVNQGFNQLYNTNTYLFDKFAKYWQKVASVFKGNPYVIAYELINQPWVGNIYKNPFLLIPSVAQTLKFQGFYDVLAWKIKQIDSETPLCFEPITFDNFIPTGLSHPPGGKRFQNMSIFCYHYYKPPELSPNAIDKNVQNGKKLNIPTLLSETYGYEEQLVRAERIGGGQSWMYWLYKNFGDVAQRKGGRHKFGQQKNFSGNSLFETLMKQSNSQSPSSSSTIKENLIRTYMPIVAGQMIAAHYNSSTNHYVGTYWANPSSQASSSASSESILFINTKGFSLAQKFQVSVIPKDSVQLTYMAQEGTINNDNEINKNFIKIKYTGSTKKKILVSVTQL